MHPPFLQPCAHDAKNKVATVDRAYLDKYSTVREVPGHGYGAGAVLTLTRAAVESALRRTPRRRKPHVSSG